MTLVHTWEGERDFNNLLLNSAFCFCLTNCAIAQMAHRVHAELSLSQASRRLGFGHLQFRVDVLEIPFKWLALQIRAQFHSFVDAERDFGSVELVWLIQEKISIDR